MSTAVQTKSANLTLKVDSMYTLFYMKMAYQKESLDCFKVKNVHKFKNSKVKKFLRIKKVDKFIYV